MILAGIAAALSGVAMAIQGSLNGALSKVIGVWTTTFLVLLIGVTGVGIPRFALGLEPGSLGKLGAAPWYLYLGGLLSGPIVFGVASSIPRLGVAPATTAIIVGQVLTATLIDHFGLLGLNRIPLSWMKGLGLVLLASGAWLLLDRPG
ncbi:MAG: DMT family transporter [Bacillota bacterium]